MPRLRTTLAAIVFFLIIAVVLAFSSQAYSTLIQQEAIRLLSQQGILAAFTDPRAKFQTFRAREAKLKFRRFPFPVSIKDLKVSVPVSSLLTLNPAIVMTGELYEGKTKISVGQLQSSPVIQFALNNIHVANYPLSQILGITEGTISGTGENVTLSNIGPTDGECSFTIQNLSKPHKTTLPQGVASTLLLREIPRVENIQLDLGVQFYQDRVEITRLEGDSSLLNIQHGKGRMSDLKLHGKKHHILNADVQLTKEGQKLVGPWLPLISNNILSSETGKFQVALNSQKGGFRFLPIATVQGETDKAHKSMHLFTGPSGADLWSKSGEVL